MPTPPPDKTVEYITASGLCGKRGWSQALIERFLGAPDKTAPNRHYRSGPPARLYSLDRVLAVEATEAFAAAMARRRVREQIGKAVAFGRRRDLLNAVAAMEVTVVAVRMDELLKDAIDSYNLWQEERGFNRDDYDSREAAHVHSDPLFLERIQVNYIRHQLTQYDYVLERVAGKIGHDDAVQAIRRRVYEAIASTYPYLPVPIRRVRAAVRQAARSGRTGGRMNCRSRLLAARAEAQRRFDDLASRERSFDGVPDVWRWIVIETLARGLYRSPRFMPQAEQEAS